MATTTFKASGETVIPRAAKDGANGEKGDSGLTITFSKASLQLAYDGSNLTGTGMSNYTMLKVVRNGTDVTSGVSSVTVTGTDCSVGRMDYAFWVSSVTMKAVKDSGGTSHSVPVTAASFTVSFKYDGETYTATCQVNVDYSVNIGGLYWDNDSLKSSYSSLTGSGGRLETMETSISQNAAQISLKASQTDVDDVKSGLKESGIDITAQEITLTSGKVYIKNGTSSGTLIEGGKIKADYVDAATVVANGINAATINAGGATISNLTVTDVSIEGTSRSPFQEVGKNMENKFTDNLSLVTNNGWLSINITDVSVKQVGRLVHLINYRWGSNYQQSAAYLSLPDGYYFFENGVRKSKIKISRECVTMLGIGDSSKFYGWVVLDRVDVLTNQTYGRGKKVLAYGKVTGTTTGASIEYATFDGYSTGDGQMLVVRNGTGDYAIGLPSSWNIGKPFVMLTGVGYVYEASQSPAKATLIQVSGTQMRVLVSNGETCHDGSFYFEISNWEDFSL